MKKLIFIIFCMITTILLISPFYWLFGVPAYVIFLVLTFLSDLKKDWKYILAFIPLAPLTLWISIFLFGNL